MSQTVADVEATADPDDPNYSFEDSMLGRTADDVAATLAAAKPAVGDLARYKKQLDREERKYTCDD